MRPSVVLLLAVVLAAPAAAQPTDPATLDPASKAALLSALRGAHALFDQGAFDEALVGYDRAFGLARLADVQYRRALCLERLDRAGEAIEALRSYLELSPEARNRGRIEREIARLTATVESHKYARLQVISHPAGVEVRLGGPSGERLGTTPLDARVVPGVQVLYLSAPGFLPSSQRVLLQVGESAVVELPLAREAIAAPPVVAPDKGRTWGWVLFGTGGALAATAGVLGYLTAARIEEANDYDRGDPAHDRAGLDDLQAPINGLETGFWVLGGAAVVALSAGAVLVWTSPTEAPAAVGLGPGGARLDVRF